MLPQYQLDAIQLEVRKYFLIILQLYFYLINIIQIGLHGSVCNIRGSFSPDIVTMRGPPIRSPLTF